MELDADTSRRIVSYRPRNADSDAAWAAVAPLVRAAVAAAVPNTPYEAGQLMGALARLAVFCHRRGIDDGPEAWLRTEQIDRFVLVGCRATGPRSKQTFRSQLLRVREALAWAERGEAPPTRLSAPAEAGAPYTPADLAAFRTWAAALPGPARRDGLALQALAAGCGLNPGEVASARGSDVRILPGGMAVLDRPALLGGRIVAARPEWEGVLAELSRTAGTAFLVGPGRRRVTANFLTNWCTNHPVPAGLPHLSARRLRTSWIVGLLDRGVDFRVAAAAAGCSPAALTRYLPHTRPLDRGDALALLRG